MRLRLRSFLLTSALTFAPALASATTISGIYVDGGSGYNEVQDQHVHANSSANGDAVPKFSVNHGTGFAGFGAVGYGFGNGLRVEAEGLYNFSHDDYTSSQYERGYTTVEKTVYTNDSKLGTGYNPFYTKLNNTQEVPCTSTSQEISGYNGPPLYAAGTGYYNANGEFVPSSSTALWPTITTPSNSENYIPPDTCWLIDNKTEAEDIKQFMDLVNSKAAKDGIPYGYEQDGKWITPLPGAYSYNTGVIVSSVGETQGSVPGYPGQGVLQGTWNYAGHPLYTMKEEHQVPTRIERFANHNGSDESWGGFANVLYDFDLERLFGLKSIATPFIGGGAGYLWQRYNRPNTMIAAITGTHGGFSWQGIAGVAFDTGISGLQVVAQYRMIGQPGSFYNGAFNYGTEGGHAHFDQRFNHQFIVGFRYAFQNRPIHHIQPPAVRPIVTAAPAPVPARSYLVFFDWNQYALTSRVRQIVVEAAHATSYVHTTRINVNGYTDSSAAPGPAGQKYNYALSVKRARSVEAELIRNGVPASEIVIRGYGDTNPLVPTGPNTREPQNRRVEIILHA